MKQQIMIFVGGMLTYGTFSAFAHALPEPEPMGSRVYAFFYKFTQNLLANFEKAKAAKQ